MKNGHDRLVIFFGAIGADNAIANDDANFGDILSGGETSVSEIIATVRADFIERDKRTGENNWLAEILQGIGKGAGGIGHGVSAVSHDEAIIFVVKLVNSGGKLGPNLRGHVGTVNVHNHFKIELHVLLDFRKNLNDFRHIAGRLHGAGFGVFDHTDGSSAE